MVVGSGTGVPNPLTLDFVKDAWQKITDAVGRINPELNSEQMTQKVKRWKDSLNEFKFGTSSVFNAAAMAVQRRLITLGYTNDQDQVLSADGEFGLSSIQALNKYKNEVMPNCNEDANSGIVGIITWWSLGLAPAGFRSSRPKTYSDAENKARAETFWKDREDWTFPVKCDEDGNYGYTISKFNTSRSSGTRSHAAIDFIIPSRITNSLNTPATLKYTYDDTDKKKQVSYYDDRETNPKVYAMTAGTVTAFRYFYSGTFQLVVANDDGTVIRYGEVSRIGVTDIEVGTRVEAGQYIATLCSNSDEQHSRMLHMEVYLGAATGALSQTNLVYDYVESGRFGSFTRRRDLVNPNDAETVKNKTAQKIQ
jgi:hypothetical protein